MVRCCDCANCFLESIDLGIGEKITKNFCRDDVMTVSDISEAHDCSRFVKKEGLSVWDSFSDEKKKNVIEKAKGYYREYCEEIYGTEEEFINFFINDLRTKDVNSK